MADRYICMYPVLTLHVYIHKRLSYYGCSLFANIVLNMYVKASLSYDHIIREIDYCFCFDNDVGHDGGLLCLKS